ncbi:tRNA pseudouridine(13) synthase TruD [Neomoorella thermoacetica]|uniref:tRNA pseudouridine(13) synthase TruD n=1 Tax=Neomoorella thermoacetica TaxID=1525 RepID=UPI0030CEF0B2
MKLKVIPEDFVVRELARLPIREKGPYRLYLFEKKGWNTIDLLIRLAKAHRLPYRLFAYGGVKGPARPYLSVRHSEASRRFNH